ncbi:hypothetical protein SLA2020_047700 [Shorea laevis]
MRVFCVLGLASVLEFGVRLGSFEVSLVIGGESSKSSVGLGVGLWVIRRGSSRSGSLIVEFYLDFQSLISIGI